MLDFSKFLLFAGTALVTVVRSVGGREETLEEWLIVGVPFLLIPFAVRL